MKKIRFITDTSTTLTDEFIKANNIVKLPNSITDADKVYFDDRTDKQKEWVSEQVENQKARFSTSFVNFQVMHDAVAELLKECDLVLYVSLGKGYSGQYNSAMEVVKKFKGKFIAYQSDAIACNSEILIQWLVDYAKTNDDFDVKTIETKMYELNTHITTIFATPKYEGLCSSGRVPVAVAKIFKLVKLFPIVLSEEVNKRYLFFKKWSESQNKLIEALDKRFHSAPKGDEVKQIIICSSLLKKDYLDSLIQKLIVHYQIAKEKISVRTTPLVVMVATLVDSVGLCIYTKTLQKIPR